MIHYQNIDYIGIWRHPELEHNAPENYMIVETTTEAHPFFEDCARDYWELGYSHRYINQIYAVEIMDPEQKSLRDTFFQCAEQYGAYVGLPSGIEPDAQAIWEFLDDCEWVEFAGPKGDTVARAYYEITDYRGNKIGGCISVVPL